jgi:integrase
MRAKVPAVALPPDCFATRRKLANGTWRVYYWHQPRRGAKDKADRGKLTRLPDPNTPEWFQKLAELTGTVDISASMAGLWIAYKKGPRWPKAAGSARLYELTWKNHIAPALGPFSVNDIEVKHVQKLRDKHADKPTTSRTVLAVLNNIMNEAIEKGIRQDNPAKAVKRLKVTPDSAKPITPGQWAALISPDAPEELRRFAYLARGTGQRISDILKMRPDMRAKNGFVHAIQKTERFHGNDAHFDPVKPEYLAIIDAWPGFPTRPYLTFKKPMTDRLMRGVLNRYKATGAGKALEDFTFHDMRATAFCDEVMEGFTTAEIAFRRGVSEEDVRKYTRRLEKKSVADSSEKRVRGA